MQFRIIVKGFQIIEKVLEYNVIIILQIGYRSSLKLYLVLQTAYRPADHHEGLLLCVNLCS